MAPESERAMAPDQTEETIPFDDFDELAKWALAKVADGKMSYGRLSLLFDCVAYRAQRGKELTAQPEAR